MKKGSLCGNKALIITDESQMSSQFLLRYFPKYYSKVI